LIIWKTHCILCGILIHIHLEEDISKLPGYLSANLIVLIYELRLHVDYLLMDSDDIICLNQLAGARQGNETRHAKNLEKKFRER
jgi:hypothetical protein